MKSNSTRPLLHTTKILPKGFTVLLVAMLAQCWTLSAQTLINSATDGSFSSGSFAGSGWTVLNGTATNKWHVGNPTGFANAAFISNDLGTTWAYTTTSQTSVVHFYKDVSFPKAVPSFTLTFKWQATGETTNGNVYDGLIVSLAPTTFVPSTAFSPTGSGLGTGVLPAPGDKLGITMPAPQLNLSGGIVTATYTLTSDDVGNCTQNITKRLIFTWKNDATLGANPPAAVDNISLVGSGGMVISHDGPAKDWRCMADGAIKYTASPSNPNGKYTIFPNGATFYDGHNPVWQQQYGLTPGQALIIPSQSLAGVYTISYAYATDFCTFEVLDTLEIRPPARVNLKQRLIDCVAPGDSIDLRVMFDDDKPSTSEGGTWTISAGGGTITGNYLHIPNDGGCFTVNYSVDNGCGTASGSTTLLINLKASPAFTINGGSNNIFVCKNGGVPTNYVIERTSPIYGINANGLNIIPDPTWTINDENIYEFPGPGTSPYNFNSLGGTISVPPPAVGAAICYNICLTQYGQNKYCSLSLPPIDYTPCEETTCLNIIVYNDGVCATDISGADFPSECTPDFNSPPYQVCEVQTDPTLKIVCKFFNIQIPYDLVNAHLKTVECVTFCDSSDIHVKYKADNLFNEIPGFNTKLQDLDPALGVLCDVLNFCICIGWPIDISWRPLSGLGGWCTETFASLISKAVVGFTASEESGGMLVADTDGDGAFDMIIDSYCDLPYPTNNQFLTATIPNNMSKKGGFITVRHVTGWPYRAAMVCGETTINEFSLLDALGPLIDLIPVAGPIINGVIETAGCDINLAFTNSTDVQIPVINASKPVFVNCPQNGYVFSQGSNCSTSVNWSIPIAEDGCLGGNLVYVGRTNNTDSSYFNGLPVQSLDVTRSGVYQTAGPIVGSVLPLGTYQVVYSAYSCSDVRTDCAFTVEVTSGASLIQCPNDITTVTSVDQCETIVTGISLLSGAGCSSVVNYSVIYPVGSGFSNVSSNTPYSLANAGTNNDASGLPFPLGVTTVTYILMIDMNNDGDVDDTFNGIDETQTCSFTITVLDKQRPSAICVDQEIKLDYTGNATVYAVNPGGGAVFIDGGSDDNCDQNPSILIAKPNDDFVSSVDYNCTNVGDNFVTLEVRDSSNNYRTCIARIKVIDYLEGIHINLAPPELCLEANNPSQFDFSNYLTITLANGQQVQHADLPSNQYTQGSSGYFFITAFLPAAGSTSFDPGTITYDGVYTPGTGTGFVTISYLILPPGFVPPTDSNPPFQGCYRIASSIFELRQPLDMASPECMCVQENERVVKLGVVSGGLEPYRIQYSGVRLDVDSDGIADDYDGIYTYDGIHGHDINDFKQDLGELRVVYTTPVWSFTIVDARGCEIFRSGSCDNDDLLIGPSVTCPASNNTLTTEEYVCESQYTWTHPVPSDNCAVTLFDFRVTNPDGSVSGPNNLNALLYAPPAGNPPYPPSFFMSSYDYELGVSAVTYYAEDAQGNFATCSFQITVSDNDPPHFINCPAPPVVQNAESMHCDAYVDFALPLASDNCSIPSVVKIDNTGLNTGSRFPVGTTILYWEARDPSNNRDTCQIKVIVNDYWQDPILTCPANVLQNNDVWLCGAVVNNIAPVVDGPCKNNYGVTYTIYGDAALTLVKDCGVTNASGEFFDIGDSWVKYTVQNQPLLLITEVTQSGAIDRLEISNLGPADIDISCLEIRRLSGNIAANQTIGPVTMLPSLAPSILTVGSTRVFNFTFNGADNLPACYTISYMGTIFDEVATNGFAGCNGFSGMLAGGDVIRKCEDDTNRAADWVLAQNCYPLTIGSINPDLEVMPDNGTQTSLQSILPNKVSCTFKVTIKDAEDPFCGRLTTNTTYNGPGIPNISAATCNRSTIIIPAGNCIIGDIVFNRTGTATPANSTMTLISPKGIRVVITEIPDDSLSTLFAQKAEGTWILDIVPNAGQTPTITGWSLTINCLATFNLANQVLPNQPGLCGAPFTWIHPYFVDNCFAGTISVAYTTTDAACVPNSGPLLGSIVKGGYSTTQFFCVGKTTVTYTLTDAAGNVEICSFMVTVNDVEKPNLVCPQQIFVNLNGGECAAFVNYDPALAVDNCAVVDTVMTPPSGSLFTIGDHLITIVIFDAAGNSTTCTFTVSVIEYVPTDFNLICNDLSHVSMDATCVFTVDADEVLEGDNYHCYEDYIITIKNQQNLPVGNVFGSADIGKTFTITIVDPETGNSCWSLLKIEDKLVPELVCPTDITIACSESTNVSNTGNVQVTDCSTFTTVIDDEFTDFGECGSPRARILRTWIVTDKWGNQSSCSQTITITPFDLNDVVFPVEAIVDCETVYLNSNATSPNVTGRPSINGAPIGTGGFCSASIGYTDVRLEICAGSYEIYRTWLIANTCLPAGPNNPVSFVQRIRVKDFGGPQFNCPAAVTVSTDPFQCCSTAALPDMIVSEGCSQVIDLEAKVTGTNPNNGNIITFTVPGHLEDFAGNNWWNPDTLAVFDYTQCVPLGTYNVRYKATDQCGNTSFCFFELTVADLVPPVVACDQFTQVALGGDGMALINASTFDDGSTDNCCLDHFAVRRMNANNCEDDQFDATVKFCCSDIGDTILVVFRAFDCHGNINDCMVSVLVEDKIKPSCVAPAQVAVNCENFDPSLWVYGFATGMDNCCLDTITTTTNYSLFDTVCNRGTITRTFRAFDCAGNSNQCTQRVISTYLQDYYVKFPNDGIVTVCDGTGNFGEPIFFGEDCELLGVTFSDEIFTVVPDACFKIERTWSIINWCTFNPNLNFIHVPNPNPNPQVNNPANLPGPTVSACGTLPPWKSTIVRINPSDPLATDFCEFWDANANGYRYKQIIKIIDGQPPTGTFVVPACDNQNWNTPNSPELWNEMEWWDNGLQTHDLCEEPNDLCITGTDACSGANINIEYLLFLDLDGDGIMETVINSVNTGIAGLGWNTVLFNNLNTPNFSGGQARTFDERPVPFNQKYGFTIQETVTGNNKTACVRFNTQQQQNTFVAPELPHGTHKIKWLISDGCGNNKEYEYTFTVRDCKAPTVVCLNGLSVNIMPTSMIQFWAADFLQYTEDNCTPASQIKIGIRKCGTGTGFPYDANGNPVTNVIFDCTELGTQCVELWAIDAAGNADYCETYVIVQDNLGNCPTADHINVTGTLKTVMTDGVEEAIVSISGISTFTPPYLYSDLTNADGLFNVMNNVPLDATFTIAPEKDDNPLNGVTTYDLVLISKHVLGIEPFDSPYKMIAADANKSGSITTFDIVEIRKMILGIYSELPNNTSWRFVDKAFTFPNVLNPFQTAFPELVSVASAMSSQWGKDFVGIKIGDVNTSAVANATMLAEDRTTGTAIFDLEDRDVKLGETFEVSFKSAQPLKGFQFTMMLNRLEMIGLKESDHVSANNFGNFGNLATVSIDGAQEFTLHFRADKSGRLSEMLGVSGSITRAEAYVENSRLGIDLRFGGEKISGVGFELYQNQPNPFVNKTSIGFYLPEAAEATLSVFDESGRAVYQQKGQFARGANSIMLDKALLNTNGVLYYKLETAKDSATRKMIQAK